MTGTSVDPKSRKKIIIIGAGSIGRRHATNLATLGTDVSVFDVNQTLLKTICADNNWSPVFDLDLALDQNRFDAAIICIPNHLHVPYAQKAVDAGLHVFIEKPLSHNLQGVNELLGDVKKKGLIGMAGFMLRYEPGLCYIKKVLDVSQVAFARIESASHMPLWHPESDYRKSYSANRSMGGGIILDDVHEIDYACWLFGFPESVSCAYGKFSNFDIDVEDTADIRFIYSERLVTLHADYLQRRYSRNCKICLKDGSTIEWIFGNSVTEYRTNGENTYNYRQGFDINSLYIEEMREFLHCLNEHIIPESNLQNAKKILEIALEAKGGLS